jgi:YD repeat-containing protein
VVIADHTFAYDPVHNVTERLDLLTGEFEQFAYDSAYRLVQSSRGGGGGGGSIYVYALDRMGNRVSVAGGPDAGLYAQDPVIPPGDDQVHQYTQTPRGGRLYDENGNLTRLGAGTPGERDFAYDFRNRLVSTIHGGGPAVLYLYDPFGRRVARQDDVVPAPVTSHRWNVHLGVLMEEEGPGGTDVYLHGADGIVSIDLASGLGPLYLHRDALGSVTAVTDPAAGVVERADYGDYGQPSLTDGSGTPIPAPAAGNPFHFRGLRLDADTGLYFCGGGIFLDPHAGRTTSRIPIRFPLMDPEGDPASVDAWHGNPWSPGPSLATGNGKVVRYELYDCNPNVY